MASQTTRALLDRLGLALPILQAPMAGVSTPAMAAAVSGAGGLGAISVGAMGAAQAADAIEECRTRGADRLNVNVFAHEPARRDAAREAAWIGRMTPAFERLDANPPDRLDEIYTSFAVDDAMLSALVAAKPEVVSLHFGLADRARLDALRGAGSVLVASVTTLDEARAAEAAGIDAVIAQGNEAGGHRGCFDPDAPDACLGTLALVRLLRGAIRLPVIAAGGMMTGADIARALQAGAAAAQLGTAYVASSESLADEGYRAALLGGGRGTVMTRAISGRPARCLENGFTELGASVPDADIPDYPVAYDLGKALHAAGKRRGTFGYGAQWAGTGAARARAMDAATLTRTLADELRIA